MKQCIKQWLTGILSLGLVFVTHSALASSCGSHGSIDKAAHAHQHKDKKAVTADKTKKTPSWMFVLIPSAVTSQSRATKSESSAEELA